MKHIYLLLAITAIHTVFAQDNNIKTDTLNHQDNIKLHLCNLDGSPTPVYVIDGVVSTYDAFRALNPNDIVAIRVIRDSVNVHSSRRPNGSIIITTVKNATKKELRRHKRNLKKQARKMAGKN